MGRAARKGIGGGSTGGARGGAGDVPALSRDSVLVGFGEEMASSPEYDTDLVSKTLVYFDPASGRLAQRDVDIFFEFSAEGEDEDAMRESDEMKQSLEDDLLRSMQKALAEGADIENIGVRDSFEFEYLSGMSYDRSEPTYSTVHVQGEASITESEEGEAPRVIENPLQTLEDYRSKTSREVAAQIVAGGTTRAPAEMLSAMGTQSEISANSIAETTKKVPEADLKDPDVASVLNDLMEVRQELRGVGEGSKAEAAERGTSYAYSSSMEQIALASDRLYWSAFALDTARPDSAEMQEVTKELRQLADSLSNLREDASRIRPQSEVSA